MTTDDTTIATKQDTGSSEGFVHAIRVRHGECDQQGIVFNSHYLAYIDDALDMWFREVFQGNYMSKFDCVLKKVELEWFSPASPHDIIYLRPRTTRWGRTSFDVTVEGSVGERPGFTATIVYVSITPGTQTPCPVPDFVREALS